MYNNKKYLFNKKFNKNKLKILNAGSLENKLSTPIKKEVEK